MLERGLHRGSVPAAGEVVPCAPPPTCPPAAPPPTSPTSSIPTTGRWPSVRCARSGWTWAAWTSCPPTSPRATKSIGGGICEVNAAPGFACTSPQRGHPARRRGPGDRHAVPAGHAVAVPIAAVTGTNGKTTTSRMLAHIAKMAGYTPA